MSSNRILEEELELNDQIKLEANAAIEEMNLSNTVAEDVVYEIYTPSTGKQEDSPTALVGSSWIRFRYTVN